jgi:hypothetical protein
VADRNRRGAALLLALVAVIVVGLAATRTHRLALDTRRAGRAALATARAREAAASGIAVVAAGGVRTGGLPGSAQWSVVDDTTSSGERILWSQGGATQPSPAQLEAAALVAPADSLTPGTQFIRRWVVMRR